MTIVAAAAITAAAGVAAAAIFLFDSVESPTVLNVLYVVMSLLLGVVGWLALVWMLPLWRDDDAAGEDGDAELFADYLDPKRGFSITIPAPRDDEELEAA
ncbi:MAG TPA: hypothetical protein VFL87_01105, partial [Thermoleophilaceae bacterium]|nr:hypothetical protein [Thermoleophilaceae bacterium]